MDLMPRRFADQRRRAVLAVPHGDRKHADEPLDGRRDAVRGKGLQHALRVGGTSEHDAARFQFAAQVLKIIDFAVLGHDEAAGRRDHRLMPHRRQIDDRQAAMCNRDAGFGVAPKAGIVGPAMRHAIGHR